MSQFEPLVTTFVHDAGYAGIYLLMLLGNLGIPTGTEFVVTLAGLLTALGKLPGNAFTVGSVAMAGELTGGAVLYVAGYLGGRPFIERYGQAVGLGAQRLAHVEAFFTRYGSAAVFCARFVPLLRGIDALPAGVARMQPLWFFGSTMLGSLLFCYGFASLGAALSTQTDHLPSWSSTWLR